MAKANTPASEKTPKPRGPRKAAVTASDDVNQKETGATAPVSLSDKPTPSDDATAASKPTTGADDDLKAPVGDQANKLVPVTTEPRAFFPGMGRFPPGWVWKPAQTPAEEAPVEALKSAAWGLPEIAEFPAELTLVNNTRNILVVRPLNTRLLQFSTKTVQCPTARHYEAIGRELAGRALRERWDSETGLKVKYGEDQN